MSANKRKHTRIRLDSRVYLEVESPEVDGDERGEIVLCKTLDVSGSGLRLSVERELPVGAILHIGAELPGTREAFYLAGEVVWCLPDPGAERCWNAGLRLLKARDSDFARWRELLDEV